MKAFINSAHIVSASLLLTLGFIAIGCGRGDDSAISGITVENDQTKLSERLNTTQSEIPFVSAEGAGLVGDTLVALQVAALAPPTIPGYSVQANDLDVNGTAVYIAYNTAGDTYAGAIDVLDVSNVLSLQILSSVAMPGYDINGIKRSGTNLYAVGSSSTTEKAFLSRIALSGSLLTPTITEVPLTSYAGTDVTTSGTSIYTTSGDTGGLQVFDIATLAQTKSTAITDARAVGLTAAGAPIVLAGQTGRVEYLSAAGDSTATHALSGNATAASKSSLTVGSQYSVASLGEGGFTVFCNADGSIISHTAAVTLAGIDPSRTVTNAVTSYNGLIYTTNGEAGVYVYTLRNTGSLTSCGGATVSLLGTLDLGAGFSPNGIYSNGSFLYVASGLGGLKIITTVFTTLTPVSSRI